MDTPPVGAGDVRSRPRRLLDGRNAVVYGAGGAVGSAVARAFAAEGARVFLAGRTRSKLDDVRDDILAAGGAAETAEVDALDEEAVTRHAAAVVERTSSLDVSFNAVGVDDGEQGVPLRDLSADDYCRPIADYTRTHFVTAKAAARHMVAQGSGVILPLSMPMAGMPQALSGPFGQAAAAIENLALQLAAELGPRGVRVVCLRPAGMPETARSLGSHLEGMWARAADRMGVSFEGLLGEIGSGTARQRPLDVRELADMAAVMASDHARGVTGTVLNVTAGAILR